MTDQTKIKIANAFYIKRRNVFVPLTGVEIIQRTKMNSDAVDQARRSMVIGGFIASTRLKQVIIYELTSAGRGLVGVAA